MSAAIGAVITIFLGIFSRIKSGIKIIELNSQLASANHKVELLSNSIKMQEHKSDLILQQEKEKVEKEKEREKVSTVIEE